MAKKLSLVTEGNELVINVGDKFKFTAKKFDGTKYTDLVEVKKVSTTKGQMVLTYEVQDSTSRSLDGQKVIRSKADWHTQKMFLNLLDNGNGIKVKDENTFVTYSDKKAVLKAVKVVK